MRKQDNENQPQLDQDEAETEVIEVEQKSDKFKLPKIGMRNVKTAFSATLCAFIYGLFGRNPTFACIGAVFGMNSTLPSSLKTGGYRLIGTVLGGLIGMGLFSVSLYFPHSDIFRMALLFVGIILLIYTSQLLHITGAIQAGAVVFCIVMFNTPEDQYISYSLNRIFDTGVGVVMSIVINWIHIKMPSKFDG